MKGIVKNKDWWKQLIVLIGGVLTSIFSLLSFLNIHYGWFTPDSINAFTAYLGALVTFVLGISPLFHGTFFTKVTFDKAKNIVDTFVEQQQYLTESEKAKFLAFLNAYESQKQAEKAEGNANEAIQNANLAKDSAQTVSKAGV